MLLCAELKKNGVRLKSVCSLVATQVAKIPLV